MLRLFRRDPDREARRRRAIALYDAAVAASREPALFAVLGVPDTVEGRFESLSLHLALLLRRLGALPSPAEVLAQDLVDHFFEDLDHSARELGVSDVGVPKKLKKLAKAFYGRGNAYDAALAAGAPAGALGEALRRNLLGEGEGAAAAPEASVATLVARARALDARLAGLDLESLVAAPFPAPAEAAA